MIHCFFLDHLLLLCFFLFLNDRHNPPSLYYDPFIHFLTPLLMQIIAYSKLKHRILQLILPLNQLSYLKPAHVPINYVPHREPNPSAPSKQLNNALSRYPLLSEYDLDVSDPCLSDKLCYFVIVGLYQRGLWVSNNVWLMVQENLQISQVVEVLVTEANDVFELVQTID